MRPSGDAAAPRVELVPVDEDVLEALIAVAIAETDPDEVTPPLEPGWGPARVAWLREFHRRCRPEGEEGDQLTAAVCVDGRVCGAVRWHRVSAEDLECGIWLAGSARGRGLSGAVLDLMIEHAATTEARRLIARTTAGNGPALAVLRRAGAAIESGPGLSVSAVIELER